MALSYARYSATLTDRARIRKDLGAQPLQTLAPGALNPYTPWRHWILILSNIAVKGR